MTKQTSRISIPSHRPDRRAIIAGPTKDELKAALFDQPQGEHRVVTFRLTPAAPEPGTSGAQSSTYSALTVVGVCIQQIGRESDTGESWSFEGWVPGLPVYEHSSVRGYYDTRSNKGWLVKS